MGNHGSQGEGPLRVNDYRSGKQERTEGRHFQVYFLKRLAYSLPMVRNNETTVRFVKCRCGKRARVAFGPRTVVVRKQCKACGLCWEVR